MLLGLQGKENKEVQEDLVNIIMLIFTFLLSCSTLVEKRSFPRSGVWRKGEEGGREGMGQEQVTPCRGRQAGWGDIEKKGNKVTNYNIVSITGLKIHEIKLRTKRGKAILVS